MYGRFKMKIFFTYSHEKFLNSYLVVNEKLKEALLIDPLKLGMETISIIERHKLNLTYILFTHGDKALQKEGILTTAKVYTHVSVIRSDYQLSAENSELYEKTNFQLLNSGDGKITLAGFDVEYFAVSGLTPGAHLFKIENAVFCGDAMIAGRIGETANIYASQNLYKTLHTKLCTLEKELILFPSRGAPSSLAVELIYNHDLKVMPNRHKSPFTVEGLNI